MGVWVVSTFLLLWIVLLQTFMNKLFECLLPILWGIYQGVELLGHEVIQCLTDRNLPADLCVPAGCVKRALLSSDSLNEPARLFPFPALESISEAPSEKCSCFCLSGQPYLPVRGAFISSFLPVSTACGPAQGSCSGSHSFPDRAQPCRPSSPSPSLSDLKLSGQRAGQTEFHSTPTEVVTRPGLLVTKGFHWDIPFRIRSVSECLPVFPSVFVRVSSQSKTWLDLLSGSGNFKL